MKYKKYLRYGLPVFAGAAIGYLYYYFIGCNSGGCAITGNPFISSLYGAAAGGLLIPSKKVHKKPEDK